MNHYHYFRKPTDQYGVWCGYGFGVMYMTECRCRKLEFIFLSASEGDADKIVNVKLYKKFKKHLPKIRKKCK